MIKLKTSCSLSLIFFVNFEGEETLGGHDHLSEKEGEAGPPGGDKKVKSDCMVMATYLMKR